MYPGLVRSQMLAIGIILSLALWVMAPALQEPGSALVGDWMHPDCISNHWLLIWVAEQLSQGQGIIENSAYYWPVGDSPVLAGNGAEGVSYLPFHLLMDWPTSSVFYLTTVLFLNGLGGWALGRVMGASVLPALLPAAAAIASPYLMGELTAGRFSQVSIGWMLLGVASWVRLMNQPSKQNAIISGGLWAITGFFYWYHAWFLALGLIGLLVAQRIGQRAIPWRAVLLGSCTAAVLIAPWAILFFGAWTEIPGTSESFPPPQAAQDSIWPTVPFLGTEHGKVGAMSGLIWLLGLIGAVAALFRGGVLTRWALAIWLLFTLLAMGPFASWAPYSILYDLTPPLKRFWWPMRHIGLASVIWAALGAVWLSGPRWGAPLAVIAALCAPVLLSIQGAQSQVRTTQLATAPGALSEIAELSQGVVLQPPLAPQAAGSQIPLLFQIFHKKTLLSGHAPWVDRVRPEQWDHIARQNTYLSALMSMERGDIKGELRFDPEDLATLIDQGLRWLVLDRSTFPFSLQSAVKAHRSAADALFGAPIIRAKGLKVWDMHKWNGESHIVIPLVVWPEDLPHAGPERPLTSRRPHPPSRKWNS